MHSKDSPHTQDRCFISTYVCMRNPDNGCRSMLRKEKTRPLRGDEIDTLQRQGNMAYDWELIRVTDGFLPDNIYANRFTSWCILGRFDELVDSAEVPVLSAGIYHSVIGECEVGDNALVAFCRHAWRYIVYPGACVYDVGALVCGTSTQAANGLTVHVGPETGQRSCGIDMDMSFDDVLQCIYRDSCGGTGEENGIPATDFGVIDSCSTIVRTSRVHNCCIGKHVTIRDVQSVSESSAKGSEDRPVLVADGAFVERSCLQAGCEVSSMAHVSRSLLCAGAGASRHGKIMESIVAGPTHVEEGEVTASLLGPAVGFHHQALCISVLWPGGKGNVGYGANVGSNHTGRVADQELRAGDGLFFGLGVNIKYPADFSSAHWSIIATGVTTLPQKMTFPFSLISMPRFNDDDIPPAYNQLSPAWVLQHNVYGVLRNEYKLKKRLMDTQQSMHSPLFTVRVLQDMNAAADSLDRFLDRHNIENRVYDDRNIDGAGKNSVQHSHIEPARNAYRRVVDYVLLRQWVQMLQHEDKDKCSMQEAAKAFDQLRQEYSTTTLVARIDQLRTRSVDVRMEFLVDLDQQIYQAARASKQRDYVRGNAVFADYERIYGGIEDDALLGEIKAEQKQRKAFVTRCLDR